MFTEVELTRISLGYEFLLKVVEAARKRLRGRWQSNLRWYKKNDEMVAAWPEARATRWVLLDDDWCADYSDPDSDEHYNAAHNRVVQQAVLSIWATVALRKYHAAREYLAAV